jgi:threonine/homoserine/homoserine lactone efflux protein
LALLHSPYDTRTKPPLPHLLAGCGDYAGAEQCDDHGDRIGGGDRAGMPCVVGAAAGMAALLFTAALGLGQLILGHPEILRVMNWCGAAFLLWLAWKIANAGRAGEAGAAQPVGFFGAAFFQWINPKGWLVAAGAAGTYLQPEANSQLLQALVFGGLFFSVALPSGFVWLVLGAAMQGWLRDERSARIFNTVMALALAASVVMIFW